MLHLHTTLEPEMKVKAGISYDVLLTRYVSLSGLIHLGHSPKKESTYLVTQP